LSGESVLPGFFLNLAPIFNLDWSTILEAIAPLIHVRITYALANAYPALRASHSTVSLLSCLE
jgi:hypothetical protein